MGGLALVLAAAVAVAAAAGGAAGAPPSEIRWGIFMPSDRLPRMLRHVALVNEREDLLPNTTIVPVYRQYRKTGDSYMGALAMVGGCNASERVDAFTVPWSQSTLAAGLVAAQYNVPLVANNAGGGALSDNEVYPTTVRVSYSDAYRARVIVALLRHEGWGRIGLVALAGEPYSDTLGAALLRECKSAGIEVAIAVEFGKDDTEEDTAEQMALLRAADARVIVGSLPPLEVPQIMEGAAAAGLVGERYQWILTLSMSPRRYVAAEMWRGWPHLEGALSINWFTNETEPGYAPYLAWVHSQIEAGHQDMARSLTDTTDRARLEALLLTAHAFQLKFDEEERCEALGDAARRADEVCAYLLEHEDRDTRTVYFLKRVEYEGTAGRVSLDENGDVSGPYAVRQYRWHDNVTTYNASEPLAFDITSNIRENVVGYYNARYGGLRLGPITYYGGAAARPLDGPVHVNLEAKIPRGLRVGVAAAAAAVAAAALALVAFTVAQRRRPIVEMSSPRANVLSSLGCAVAMATLAVLGLGSDTDAKCEARRWLLPLSVTLVVAPLCAKLWRVHGAGAAARSGAPPPPAAGWELFAGVGAVLAADAALLAAWGAASPVSSELEVVRTTKVSDDLVEHEVVHRCRGENGSAWLAAVVSFKAALLVAGAVLAFKTRGVKVAVPNDAKWAGFAVYNLLLALSFGLPVAITLSDDPAASYGITAAAMLFAAAGTLLLVHGPKLAAIATGNEEAWTMPGTAPSTTRSRSGAPSSSGDRSSTRLVIKSVASRSAAPHSAGRRGSRSTLPPLAEMPVARLRSSSASSSSASNLGVDVASIDARENASAAPP